MPRDPNEEISICPPMDIIHGLVGKPDDVLMTGPDAIGPFGSVAIGSAMVEGEPALFLAIIDRNGESLVAMLPPHLCMAYGDMFMRHAGAIASGQIKPEARN